ncbi:hypothetical protein Tco_0597491 [Tanacetum coccineum]
MANLEFCDKHNMVAYLKKPTGNEGFQEIVDFLNGRGARERARSVDNGEKEIIAAVDGKEFIITEASVRRHLQLADVDGISVLPTSEIFDQLSLMGNALTDDKLTFQKVQAEEMRLSIKECDTRVERATTTAASLDAEQASGNINKTQSTIMPNVPLPQGIGAGGSPRGLEGILHKQGRMIEEIDQDAGVTLVTPTLITHSAAKVLANATKSNVHTYTRRREVSTGSGGISTASGGISTAEESVSTIGASMPVSTIGMVQEVNIIITSPVVVKDKGKGKMEESVDEQTKRTKLQQEQERLGHEAGVRLQEELDEEERQRMARVLEAAQSFTEEEWENIRARVEADEELSRRLQAEERNKYSEVDQAKMLVDLINQRKKYFAAQKAKAKRNKPMTQAQQKNYMINYIKHMGSHTLQQLKRYSFDELKELFETTMKNVSTFIPMETEDRERASELAAGSSQATITNSTEVGSSKRAAEAELDHEGSKRQKTNEAS